jgi:hypothetical protein
MPNINSRSIRFLILALGVGAAHFALQAFVLTHMFSAFAIRNPQATFLVTSVIAFPLLWINALANEHLWAASMGNSTLWGICMSIGFSLAARQRMR